MLKKCTACKEREGQCIEGEFCKRCYDLIRYHTETDFREKMKQRNRRTTLAWFHRKNKEEPEWNAKRQRKYRKKYPERYVYMMAKSYFKRLTQEQKKKLIKEVM